MKKLTEKSDRKELYEFRDELRKFKDFIQIKFN